MWIVLGLKELTILIRVLCSIHKNEVNHSSLFVVSFWGVVVEDSQIDV